MVRRSPDTYTFEIGNFDCTRKCEIDALKGLHCLLTSKAEIVFEANPSDETMLEQIKRYHTRLTGN